MMLWKQIYKNEIEISNEKLRNQGCEIVQEKDLYVLAWEANQREVMLIMSSDWMSEQKFEGENEIWSANKGWSTRFGEI